MRRKPQTKMARKRENLSKTQQRSNQDEEKIPIASEVVASTSTSATASAPFSDDQDDSHLQCEIKPTEARAFRTIRKLFRGFKARRAGILKALTMEVESFYGLCDPDKENLCLYGLPNGTWDVKLPPEEVPPEMPEPTLGINFARDGTAKKQWLACVAAHSDAWLIALTFYLGARFGLDKQSRGELFEMINDLPTILEVVMEAAKEPTNERTPNNSRRKSKKSASQRPSPDRESPACSSKRPFSNRRLSRGRGRTRV